MPVTRQSGLDQSDLLRTAPAVLLTIGLTALLTDSLGTASHLSPDDARDQLGIVITTAVVSAVLAAVVGTSAGTAAVCATVLVSWGAGAHFLLDMNDGDRTAISCIAMAGMLWGLSMTCTADEAVIKGDRALISRGQAILRDPTILMAAFFLSSLAAGGVEATFALYDNDTYHHETIVILASWVWPAPPRSCWPETLHSPRFSLPSPCPSGRGSSLRQTPRQCWRSRWPRSQSPSPFL